MKKIYGLTEWRSDKRIPADKQTAQVRIHFKYIDMKKVVRLSLKQRRDVIDKHLKRSLQKILTLDLFEGQELIGTKRRPSGIKTNMLLEKLPKIAQLAYVEHIFVESVKGAKKVKQKPEPGIYCIKMTVAIQIEKTKTGMQTYEERYVLIKAFSSEEAYKKIKKTAHKYEMAYLNPYSELVRWKIESLDDCFDTCLTEPIDLDNPEGVEVFSVLKKRRMKPQRVWEGK